MASARVLCGVAGSGKTHRVLREALTHMRAELSGSGQEPTPLYIIVPEQHTLVVERQLLGMLQALPEGRRAYCGLQVTSFTRLGRTLHGLDRQPPQQLSELGRRLIAWRLLDGSERQAVRAAELSQLIAELVQYGTSWEELNLLVKKLDTAQQQAAGIAGLNTSRFAAKLNSLSGHYRDYCDWCEKLELQVRDWAQEISLDALRKAAANPQASANPLLQFGNARFWFDGFMGLTRPELSAARALLQVSSETTLTLLLDPGLAAVSLGEQAAHPLAEWYAPTLELLEQWRIVCRDAGADLVVEPLSGVPRYGGSELAQLSLVPQKAAGSANTNYARAFICPSLRGEIELACCAILELVQQRGWRFSDICLLTRDVDEIAPLLEARLKDHGIAAHLDSRASLGGHPLVEYVKCALRLASGSALAGDIPVLLGTGLLPGQSKAFERLWRLEYAARQRRLRPGKWLDARPWEEGLTREGVDGSEQILDAKACHSARLAAFAPVLMLKAELTGWQESSVSVIEVLTCVWRCLLGTEIQQRIAEEDLPVLEQLATLWDEIALVARELSIGRGGSDISFEQLQQWLEFGLDQLSQRPPPVGIDQLVIAGVEEGRVPPVKGVLILGLAEDSWQPALGGQRYFTEAERVAANLVWREQAISSTSRATGLLAPGAEAAAQREAYLALVAATRAAEFVQFSYANLDRERKPRRPSRYFNWLCSALGVQPQEYHGIASTEPLDALAAVFCAQEAALLAVAEEPVVAQEELREVLPSAMNQVIEWRRASQSPAFITASEYWRDRLLNWRRKGDLPVLATSATQLEMFASCPYQFFVKYFAALREPDDPELGNRLLGSLYHDVLRRLLEPAAEKARASLSRGESPAPVDWIELAAQVPQCIEQSFRNIELHEDIERKEFVKQRCHALIIYLLSTYASNAQQGSLRWPVHLEAAFGRRDGLVQAELASDGFSIALQGKLDRVDLTEEHKLAVVDYKLGQRSAAPWKLSAGLELQLPVYLLALCEPLKLAGDGDERVWPRAQAEYQPLEFKYQSGQASLKPAQIPTQKMIAAAGNEPDLGEAGVLGYARSAVRANSNAIRKLACPPQPVRSPGGNWTACQHCHFQPLCRFDALAGGRYRQAEGLPGRTNSDLQAWLAEGRSRGAGKEQA